MSFFYLVSCLLFILLLAFFSGIEIAFISSSHLKLRHEKEKNPRAELVYQLLSKPERFLAATLVGGNICVVISSSLATYFLISIGIPNSHLWVTALFTPLIVIFAELVPKNIGRYYKETFAIRAVNIFKIFEVILNPLVRGIEKLSTFLIKVLLGEEKKKPYFMTREGIKALVAEVEKEGILEKGEKEAIEEIFDFRDTKIKDVCIPFGKIVSIDYSASLEEIMNTAKIYGFTRYPVFRNKQILGYINVFDLFYTQTETWQSLVRPITYVGASQKLYEIFTLLKNKKENIAVVMKGKKILGMVTLHDLIKEILHSIIK